VARSEDREAKAVAELVEAKDAYRPVAAVRAALQRLEVSGADDKLAEPLRKHLADADEDRLKSRRDKAVEKVQKIRAEDRDGRTGTQVAGDVRVEG
jgi:hypothetical protein